MYSPTITNRRLQLASDAHVLAIREANAKHGTQVKEAPLERHSARQIAHAIAHFDGLWDRDQKALIRSLRPDEAAFITNERKVCALDYNYWEQHYCNPPDAPIWMADLSFKPIGDVKVGDVVMGWVKPERPAGTAAKWWRHHYAPSTVLAVQRRRAPLVEVHLASGRVIRCTPDHNWSNGGTNRSGSFKANPQPWTTAKIGARLRHVIDVPEPLTPEQERLAAWLGGIYDGEGSANHNGIQIAQCPDHNPEVSAAIAHALTALGFAFTRTAMTFRVLGGMKARVRFLRLCRPVRHAKIPKVLDRQVDSESDPVVAVREIGTGEVVSMQTTTGNYVAHGYLSKNCWIVNWQKVPQKFVPNVAQQVMGQMWGEFEDEGRAIWMQVLKARRLGISTKTELALLHRFQFHAHTNAVIASADPEKTVLMANMLGYAYEQQPWWLMPPPTKIHKGLPAEFGEINSGLSLQAGNQFNGVARGSTPNVVHLSELCEWQHAEILIDSALMRAIVDTDMTFGILESTALGRGNWWHNTWKQTKADWDRGRARMRPVFFPWFMGTDLYPSEADLRARPVPGDWVPSDRTIKHAERAREYVIGNPFLLKYLAKGDKTWQLPRTQMHFHEMEYETAHEKGTLNLFLSEMPADDIEAFQSSNISVIDQEILLNYRSRTRAPLAAYTIVGEGIPQSLVAPRSQWDLTQQAITIKTNALLPHLSNKYQFIPLRVDDYFGAFDPMLKLLIWDWPEDEEIYGIGVDTSDGIGQDRAVIEAVRKSSPARCDAQVAELASPYIKAFQLWPLTLAIATFYSTYQAKIGRRAQARVAIEIKGNGETVQYELQKRGWTNFHPWKRYDNKKMTPDGAANKLGVYTNVWFRSQMMDLVLSLIDEEAFDAPSRFLVEEFEALERDVDQQKAKAAYGEHDDRIMAIGFPLFSLHVGDSPRQQFQRRKIEYVGPDDQPIIVHPTWQPPAQANSLAFAPPQQRLLAPRHGGGLLRFVNDQMPRGFR